jgi:formylglycine-generating enzyme
MQQFSFSKMFSVLVMISIMAFPARAQTAAMQSIGAFEIDVTEVSVAQFRSFVQATGLKTTAEISGGNTYEAGWEQRKGWHWQTPFGRAASSNEPVVHVNYPEAAAYCSWAGKRLPTDAEWGEAAYTERRAQPTDGFITGRTYRYPTGDSPQGANCLGDCGSIKTVSHAVTSRGKGHAEVATTRRGINGLYDMGGNAWEWESSGAGSASDKRTRGGSWWYGASSMLDTHVQSKPALMSAVYIGFRCVKEAR